MAGLCETKRRGEWLRELSVGGDGDGAWMYEVGKAEGKPYAKGLALIVNKNFTEYVEKLKKKPHPVTANYTRYAPTSFHDDETVEMFYEELVKAVDKKT